MRPQYRIRTCGNTIPESCLGCERGSAHQGRESRQRRGERAHAAKARLICPAGGGSRPRGQGFRPLAIVGATPRRSHMERGRCFGEESRRSRVRSAGEAHSEVFWQATFIAENLRFVGIRHAREHRRARRFDHAQTRVRRCDRSTYPLSSILQRRVGRGLVRRLWGGRHRHCDLGRPRLFLFHRAVDGNVIFQLTVFGVEGLAIAWITHGSSSNAAAPRLRRPKVERRPTCSTPY